MKSIYEAAVAYGREHQGTVNIEDFEAGANYVLDHLSKTIHVSYDAYLKDNLFKMIKELKK